MNRYFIKIKYDGSKFHGFQRQNELRSVQKDIEEVLSEIFDEPVEIKGAGRTDAGVHALGQCATFDVEKKAPINIKYLLNKKLTDMKILKFKKVNERFHARFNAKGKKYIYKIKVNSREKNNYYLSVKNIDMKKIKEISKVFVGTYDFHNFVSGYRDDYVSTIKKISAKKIGNYVYITFKGVGFYRYMVRNIVGAILDYNKGKVTKEEIRRMLVDKKYDKQLSTVLPSGLYLVKVYY